MIGAPTGDSRQGLKRHQRIAKSADFNGIFTNGRKCVGKYVIMWYLSAGTGRLGVVAAKKTFRRAVDRNRAKRLMREAFRLVVPQCGCKGDMVLIGRRKILDVKMQAVQEELLGLVQGV